MIIPHRPFPGDATSYDEGRALQRTLVIALHSHVIERRATSFDPGHGLSCVLRLFCRISIQISPIVYVCKSESFDKNGVRLRLGNRGFRFWLWDGFAIITDFGEEVEEFIRFCCCPPIYE